MATDSQRESFDEQRAREEHESQLYREESYEHSFGTANGWIGVTTTANGIIIDAGEYDRYEKEISLNHDEAEGLYAVLKDYLGH